MLKRKKLGMTQQKLAELAGVSLPTVQNIESGKANPSLEVLNKISSVIGLSVELKTLDVDWDLLASLGVPLTAQIQKPKIRPTRQILELELRKAIVSTAGKSVDRKIEALAATLLALKTHWPSVYEGFGSLKIEADQLINLQDLGRLLKLRPLAISKLQAYF